MRKSHAELPRYTWDQCAILNIWPATAFGAIKINAATIRSWASREIITPVGKGPNGSVLYRTADIEEARKRVRPKGGRGIARNAELPPCNSAQNLSQ